MKPNRSSEKPAEPSVLMISKPVVAPWNDSGKNLVRDIVTSTPGYQFRVMTTRGAEAPAEGALVEPIYGDAGSYRPSLKQNLRVLKRLARPDKVPIYHFFFAPNPRTSSMARWVLRFKRRRTVHTVCSRPKSFEGITQLMFAERVVALSEHTRAALEEAGVQGVVHIPPAVPDGAPMSDDARRATRERYALGDDPIVLYAGDYEFSEAAHAVADAAVRLLQGGRKARVVFACRLKQEASKAVEAEIRQQIEAAGVADRVTFLNEIDDILALVAAADVQVQPAGSLYAKMDVPLVLLESLKEGVPLVLGDRAPLNELLADDVGLAVPPEDGEALAEAVARMLDDTSMRRQMGMNGKRVIAERYGAKQMGAAYAALYDELLSTPR